MASDSFRVQDRAFGSHGLRVQYRLGIKLVSGILSKTKDLCRAYHLDLRTPEGC